MIRGSKSIAEYAIRRWMERENFTPGYFVLKMDGNLGTITDKSGEELKLVYDSTRRVVREYEEGESYE